MNLPKELERVMEIACRSDATLLLTGPTGSGKSTLAREIHERSSRREKPFVTVNLATLHEGTLESELFGHERGAFTGADQRRTGRMELAQGGTLFLDEIGELSPRLQARLLEVLQSRRISPVGGNREVRLDVRIIAATHRNLEQAVARGEFREDLFHRLRVLVLPLKSLCEREGEFDRILHDCLEKICMENRRSVKRISEEFAWQLESHPWPGNLRELRNVLEYAVLVGEGEVLEVSHLPPWFAAQGSDAQVVSGGSLLGVAEIPLTLDFHETTSRFEKEYLRRALERYRGRINQTARMIGINKATLIRRIRAYDLHAGPKPF